MQAPIWRFREKLRAEMHQESAHTEFFANQDVADKLIRESGQNTLDAALDAGPARLSFSFTEAPAQAFHAYSRDLWPHLEAHADLRSSLPSPSQPIPCLVVEDFGTSGLTGSLEAKDYRSAATNEPAHRLFWFFKNVGRTSKSGDRLGSFGIGKTVFPYSSRINTFFGLSTRSGLGAGPPTVLLGQSHLREHRLRDSGDLDPIGFFALHEGDGADYEQRPIIESSQLEDFRSTFGLVRRPDETGLSVVIPYPDGELTLDALGGAAIEHFFLPILTGKLVVDIQPPLGDLVRLSADTLTDAVRRFEWKRTGAELMRKRIDLAVWATGDGLTSLIELERPSDPRQPQFDASMLGSSRRIDLSQRFLEGRRLAFRIPVPIEGKDGSLEYSHVDLFMENDASTSKSDDIYARDGLTLIDHHGVARQGGLRSILLAQDPPVSTLLRASENVAHTKWRQRGALRLKNQFERGSSKVGYILGLASGVVQALLSPDEKADWWTLADMFPEPLPSELPKKPVRPAENGNSWRGEPEDGTPTEDEIECPAIPPGKTRQWLCKPSRDGIVIESNPAYSGSFRQMKLTVAYGLVNRPGFGAHRREDFSFFSDGSMVQADNADVYRVADNVLSIRPKGSPFRVEVAGFDRHRALDYRIATIQEP